MPARKYDESTAVGRSFHEIELTTPCERWSRIPTTSGRLRYACCMAHLGVYPGSFDPPTLGHLDVIERAAKIFDRLIVAVGINRAKKPLLTPDQRIEAVKQSVTHLPNVEVASFQGLLSAYAASVGADAIVRGLRATADFEYEFQMAMVNRRMQPDIETVFFMTNWETSYVSSSIVKEVALLHGDFQGLVPEPVARIVEKAVRGRTHK